MVIFGKNIEIYIVASVFCSIRAKYVEIKSVTTYLDISARFKVSKRLKLTIFLI